MDSEKRKNLLKIITSTLGLEEEDVTEEDSLDEELHLSPSDIFDLVNKLELPNFDPESLDLTPVETVGDLLDVLEEEV